VRKERDPIRLEAAPMRVARARDAGAHFQQLAENIRANVHLHVIVLAVAVGELHVLLPSSTSEK